MVPYWCHGLETSIALGHWTMRNDDYHLRLGKIQSGPINFVALHSVLGTTVLTLGGIMVLFPGKMTSYAHLYFLTVIFFAIHSFPSCFIATALSWWVFFSAAFVCMFASFCGLLLVHASEGTDNSTKLQVINGCIVFCLLGGAYGEGMSILQRLLDASQVGHLVNSPGGDLPGPLSGHTFYDKFLPTPLIVGFIIVWILMIWIGGGVSEVLKLRGVIAADFWKQRLLSASRYSLLPASPHESMSAEQFCKQAQQALV